MAEDQVSQQGWREANDDMTGKKRIGDHREAARGQMEA